MSPSSRASMAARVSWVIDAECGCSTTLSSARKRASMLRLRSEHVERGAGDPALLQGGDQRLLVDHRAARDVDQIAVAAEPIERRAADQVARRLAARAAQHQHVGPLRQLQYVADERPRRVRLGTPRRNSSRASRSPRRAAPPGARSDRGRRHRRPCRRAAGTAQSARSPSALPARSGRPPPPGA